MKTIKFEKSTSLQNVFVLKHIAAVSYTDVRINTFPPEIDATPVLSIELTNSVTPHYIQFKSITDRNRAYRNLVAELEKLE